MLDISPFSPFKLLFHRDRIEASLSGQLTYPISVEIDLSNVCPHDCPFCSFGTSLSQGYRQKNWVTFPYPRILDLLTELRAVGVESVTFTGGGEPLIHKHAAEIFHHTTDLELQWGLVTNGLLLRGEVAREVAAGAKFVRVSLDAGYDDTHMATHGIEKPQLPEILGNIAALRKLNDRLIIGTSYCVMPRNFREILYAAERVKKAGGSYLEVRPTFPTDWRGDGWTGELKDWELTAALAQVQTARDTLDDARFRVLGLTQRFDSLAAPEKKYTQCRIGKLTTVIGADGTLWHCCVQRGQEYFKLQSVATRPFAEVWQSINKSRRDDRIDVSKCPRCRYDGYNELLEKAVLADTMHRSFV